jgi:hypothetical protein
MFYEIALLFVLSFFLYFGAKRKCPRYITVKSNQHFISGRYKRLPKKLNDAYVFRNESSKLDIFKSSSDVALWHFGDAKTGERLMTSIGDSSFKEPWETSFPGVELVCE